MGAHRAITWALGSLNRACDLPKHVYTALNALNFSVCAANAQEGAFIDLRSLGNF